MYIYRTNAKQNRNDNKKIKNFFPVILKIDDIIAAGDLGKSGGDMGEMMPGMM